MELYGWSDVKTMVQMYLTVPLMFNKYSESELEYLSFIKKSC
jgi:hypothetical protein